MTEFATGQILKFFWNHLVTSEHDIERSHTAHNLAGRSNKRRITEVRADTRHFIKQILIFVFHTLFLELVRKVGEHTARNLEVQNIRIDIKITFKIEFFDEILLHLCEVLGNRNQLLTVKLCITGGFLKCFNHCLSAGLRCITRKRCKCCVNDINTCFNCFKICHGTKSACVVGMKLNRNLYGSL